MLPYYVPERLRKKDYHYGPCRRSYTSHVPRVGAVDYNKSLYTSDLVVRFSNFRDTVAVTEASADLVKRPMVRSDELGDDTVTGHVILFIRK